MNGETKAWESGSPGASSAVSNRQQQIGHPVPAKPRPRPLNLALQGGGAHGAFTWGVLDALLERDDVEPGWLSGTSAGAINALALADGLARGNDAGSGREAARAKLRAVWEGVAAAAVPDLFSLNPFFYGFVKSASLSQMSGYFSPYQINPLGFDPLRQLLEDQIDFERVRQHEAGGDLIIAATDVLTGDKRLFRRAEVTVEVALASACLPTIHHAVMIDGRAYWDGGFSANPDLTTLASSSPHADTLLIQLNPREVDEVPTHAREITARANTISFNQPLLREIETIRLARAARRKWLKLGPAAVRSGPPDTRLRRIAKHRYHVIRSGEHTASLGPTSKMTPDRAMLETLFQAGREETGVWLERCWPKVGKQDTAGW
ncbi:MAG: patatin-like phospholipase family protein [Pseudomonadota bacterium]